MSTLGSMQTINPLLLLSVAALGAGSPTRAGVLTYHGDLRRSGVYTEPRLTRAAAASLHADPSFKASVQGAIYAQPLHVPAVAGVPELIVVATEQNVVAAFDVTSGRGVWTTNLDPPAPRSALPCGNIDPLGVTGTPVVDPDTRTLYLDAMTTPDHGRTKRHLLYALSVNDGAVKQGWPLDVTAALSKRSLLFDAAVQNQRGALALVKGTLYVPFGGHWGDCGDFRGWLVAVPVDRPDSVTAWRTGARGGGIWGPSGVASDGDKVYVASGNTFEARTWAGGEAVLAFVAGAPLGTSPADSFAPSNWRELDDGDIDIGGTGPLLLDLPGATPSRLAIALGKDGKIYVLDRTHLGGIGGAAVVAEASSAEIINAAAAYATNSGTHVVFYGTGVGCPEGHPGDLVALRLTPASPPRVSVAWCARQSGRGSPMVTTTDGRSEPVVWSVGAEGDGLLRGLDGETGHQLVSVPAGKVRRFQTPIAAGGRVFVAVEGGVKAFAP